MMEQQNKDSLPYTDSNKGKTRLRYNTQTLMEMRDDLTDENGEIKILPAEEWLEWGKNNLGAFLTCNNIWTVPTLELCDILDEEIGDLSCIEICAGRGIISKELNIKATDSYLKASEEYINTFGNENMQYPSFVEKLEASEAVNKYHPECVLSCYGVPRWDEEAAKRYYLDTGKELRGSVKGVDYDYILPKIKKLILVGHKELYCQHPFFKRKHRLIVNKNVLTRHSVNGQSYIYIFEKKE